MESVSEIIKAELQTFGLAQAKANELLREAAEAETSPADRFFALGIAAYEMRQYSVAAGHLHASFVAEARAETAIRLAMTHLRTSEFKRMEQWAITALEMKPNGTFFMILYPDSEIDFSSVFALSQFYLGRVDQALAVATRLASAGSIDSMAADVIQLCRLARGESADDGTGLLSVGTMKEKVRF